MSNKKKIIIGSDHAGFEMKHSIISNLSNIEFKDIGTDSDESVDYPDYANKLVKGIQSNSYSFGVLICGTGIGMSMSANRTKDIRAALCLNTKMAELSRQHNFVGSSNLARFHQNSDPNHSNYVPRRYSRLSKWLLGPFSLRNRGRWF